jgi:hemerythrin-like domain-containing protein
VLVKFLPADNPLVLQMFEEHAQIRDLIISLDKERDSGSLQSLADFVNNHIRFEERELFVYAEKTLTQEQLDEIYKELPHDSHCETDPIAIGWEDKFWVKK